MLATFESALTIPITLSGASLTLATTTMPPTAGYMDWSRGPMCLVPGIADPLPLHVNDPNFRAVCTVGTKFSTRMATVWNRGKAEVNYLLGNTSPGTCSTHGSTLLTLPIRSIPARPFPSPFPHDIVEMIIVYLICHRRTLKACSLACRSWYTAAVPHLHRTVTLTGGRPEIDRSRLEPLSKLHELGLISFAREIRVRQGPGSSSWFVPQAFGHLDLRYFSAFANVHTLNVENMQIHHFIPDIEHYFGHLSPTLQSITLYDPRCSPQQLSHFLSFFPNLDDVNIRISYTHKFDTTAPETELALLPTPRLRGRLVLYNFPWAEAWTHLISSCGGLRFHHVDLRKNVSCAPVLLEACADTLETLRFDATDGSVSA